MTSPIKTFARRAIWALPVWAAFLSLSTITHQPDPQTDFANFAAYVTTDIFLISHLLFSIVGAAIGSIGIVALLLYLQNSHVSGKMITGMVLTIVANVLNTSVFGAAAFAQRASGQMFFAGAENAQDFYNAAYAAPLFITVIIAVLLLMIGSVFTGIAITKSGRFPRWAGWLYAATVILFVLSGIFFSDVQAIMAALLTLASAAVAWSAGRRGQQQVEELVVTPGA